MRKLKLETILNRKIAGVALQCYRCQYKWTYKGKLIFASCPSCRNAIKVEIGKALEIKENNPGPESHPKPGLVQVSEVHIK